MAAVSQPCIVCGGNRWLPLPLPHPSQSVRSDGSIVSTPLHKNQCAACGLVQIAAVPAAHALEQLYAEHYDLYNNRPGSEQFARTRYVGLASEITAAAGGVTPKHVLEVGCGNGSTLEAVQSIWTGAHCVGVEPVPGAVKAARALGRDVRQGIIGSPLPQEIAARTFDVVYAVHVIEHTADPVAFLRELKTLLVSGGRLIVTCPNADVPNLEITRADHNYSMLPVHLERIARVAGLTMVKKASCTGGPEGTDSAFNQLMAFSQANVSSPVPAVALGEEQRQSLLEARRGYLESFASLEQDLLALLHPSENVLCFGAGGWASVLAGYAPALWERVRACVIDGAASAVVHGKPVIAYQQLDPDGSQRIVVGTNPAIQPALAQRLSKDGFQPIRWDNFISA